MAVLRHVGKNRGESGFFFRFYLSLKSIGRQARPAPIAGPPCARPPAHTVLRPRHLSRHIGKIDTSIISLVSKTRSSGRRQYLLLATHSQFCDDFFARLRGATSSTRVGYCPSQILLAPQLLKTGSTNIFFAYISFIGIRTLSRNVTRGYGDHSPLTRTDGA